MEDEKRNVRLEALLDRAEALAYSRPDENMNPEEFEKHVKFFVRKGKITEKKAEKLRNRIKERKNKKTVENLEKEVQLSIKKGKKLK
jgi:hypothetical protein